MSKFCYEEAEIRFADCQCEFCVYYNNGERSDECPKELLARIKNNEIRCTKIKDSAAFDFGDN